MSTTAVTQKKFNFKNWKVHPAAKPKGNHSALVNKFQNQTVKSSRSNSIYSEAKSG